MKMIESREFEELFELLNGAEVRYLIVGGYAVAIHGRPRYTDDLDLLVDNTHVNAANLHSALKEFGFDTPELTIDSFLPPDRVIQLGNPPNRIDILTSVDGVSFEEAWKNRISGQYGDQIVWFIGREDLIRTKKAAGRPKDLEDLRVLRDESVS